MAMAWRVMAVLVAVLCCTLMPIQGHGQCEGAGPTLLTYYLQQEFGVNELVMVPSAREPVNGTATGAGFGLEVVYEYMMTKTSDASSDIMGFVRGTAVVVNNTAPVNVFFVSNVVSYDYAGLSGTLSQQGEVVLRSPDPWDLSAQLSVLGGTGSFCNLRGYNNGASVSATPTPNGTLHFVTYYEAYLISNGNCC